jgi:MoaA/NifB/PqqE/SkfB family radical SAM enzyme
MLKDAIHLLGFLTDPRNHRLLRGVHQAFRRSPRYRFRHLVRAMIHVGLHERIIPAGGGYLVSSFLPPIPSRAFEQLFRATPEEANRYEDHIQARRTAPISLFMAITGRCAYRCWHCSAVGQAGFPDPSLEQLQRVIAQLQDMGTSILGLTGGEPLLRGDLEDLISAIDDRSVSILYTSGMGLTLERARDLSKAGLFATGISLDRADAPTFDRMRGHEGAWNAAVAAVDHFRAAGSTHVMVQCVADPAFLARGEHEALARLAKQIGAHEIRFLEGMPAGRLSDCGQDGLLGPEDRAVLLRFQRRANWSSRYPKVTVFAHTESADMFGCGAATQHSYMDAQGNLTPCDFVPLGFGNAFQEPLADLWKHMNLAVGIPRSRCLAFELQEQMQGISTQRPLPPQTSLDICSHCRKEPMLPRFYRLLAGQS